MAHIPSSRRASVAVILHNGHVLVVYKRGNPNHLGLPGGKQDPGETPLGCMERELLEETGLTALESRPFFAAYDSNKFTTAFIVDRCRGQIRGSTEGTVGWEPVEALLTIRARFPAWNRKMLAALDAAGV